MRKGLSILFLAILLLPSVYKLGFVVYYQLNKDYIAANYCVNKERPMTMCYGKCFLERGLQLNEESNNTAGLTASQRTESQDFMIVDLLDSDSSASVPLTYISFSNSPLKDGIPPSVFRPPLA